MAIYHHSTKLVKRSAGRNVVKSAAYRAASALYDETMGLTWDYRHKPGVEHTEIFAPDHAPAWVFDRQTLWTTVEKIERRKDAQLARDVELGLPIELSKTQQIELLRDYIRRAYVARGMIADLGVHLDNPHNPHGHILLSLRHITPEGFGLKNRTWNQTSELLAARRTWAEVTNEHLAEAGLAVRIDHRSYAEQQQSLIPGRKIGVSLGRQHDAQLPQYLADRVAEQQRIMNANGAQIIADPVIALQALSRERATFTHHDIGRFLNTRTDSREQFDHAYLKVTTAPELVGLGLDEQGRQRFTTRAMVDRERSLLAHAEQLAGRRGHGVSAARRAAVLARHRLSKEQAQAFEHVTAAGDLKSVVGVAGSGKSTTLNAMREAWEAQGLTVKGAALAGIAVDGLAQSSGISARTIASYELAWAGGRDPLTSKDVLVIDEAGMVPTRSLERLLEVAQQAKAKVVLVGDPEQLQAIEAGAPFRRIANQHGVAELSEVRRQRQAWQREATQALASGKTADALGAYQQNHAIVAVERREDARSALLTRWAWDAKQEPTQSQLVLAYTRDDVKALNTSIRMLRQQTGQLGAAHAIVTPHGKQEFAVNDRVRFLRNERSLGVKNGSLGSVEGIKEGVLSIRLDGADKALAVDTKFYTDLDLGYAATVHKAQGTTVDRTYVLATPHFDRHTAYVALSRHREAAMLWYAQADFGGRGADPDVAQARFVERLSRQQAKDLAYDYLEPDVVSSVPAVMTPAGEAKPARPPTVDELQATARQNWLAMRARSASEQPETLEDTRRRARENWLAMRESGAAPAPTPAAGRGMEHEHGMPGPEEDRARLARLTAQELRREIHQLRPEPVGLLVERDAGVQAAVRALKEQSERLDQAQRRYAQAQEEAARWRQAHALQAKLHDLGVVRSDYLAERAATEVEAQAERLTALAQHATAQQQVDAARAIATARITLESAPLRARIAQLERLVDEKARQEQTIREFQDLAAQRARKTAALEHRDQSNAMPKVLRDSIDRFNQLPAEKRERSLQRILAQPEVAEALSQALAQRQERLRQQDHGLGL